MKRQLHTALARGLALLAAAAFIIATFGEATARAETFVGSNVDSRVIVAFQVNADAAQSWLPKGWNLTPLAKGPSAGANLLVVFFDKHLARDSDGNPTTPSSYRGAALVSLASQAGSDEIRLYVTRIYATPLEYDPYSNAIHAGISRSATHKAVDNSAPVRTEEWTVKPEGGGEMILKLSYEAGIPTWSKGEVMPYSNTKPDFHRIYRYEQLADLVMSVPADKSLGGETTFTSTIPELAPMFDGSEKMISVIAIPVYVRQVFLP